MAQDLFQAGVSTRESSEQIIQLNAEFSHLPFLKRIERLYDHFLPSEVLLTSSFGGSSALILDLFSQVMPSQKIHFIDTGYHFEETIAFKDELARRLGMEVVSVHPDQEKHLETQKGQWWIDRANDCCQINKVEPLDSLIPSFKVWVSGVMAYQTTQRASFRVFEDNGNIIKFHPIIDMDEAIGNKLLESLDLPSHPLTAEGYGSIGCKYCTFQGKGREGRWTGSDKTECGLHSSVLNLDKKEN